jgi:hypothetical protein
MYGRRSQTRGRAVVKINLLRPARLQAVSFTRSDLLKIGAKAIESVQNRCARGQNVNDRRSKPLSARYRAKKEKMGQPGIRNEMFSGSMLGALTVVEADQQHVTVGFTRQAELVKASKNQDRDPWFGLSRNDEGKVLLYAERLLQNKVNK